MLLSAVFVTFDDELEDTTVELMVETLTIVFDDVLFFAFSSGFEESGITSSDVAVLTVFLERFDRVEVVCSCEEAGLSSTIITSSSSLITLKIYGKKLV